MNAAVFAATDGPVAGLSDRRTTVALGAAVLIGAALRLSNLGGKSIWLDEAFSVILARASWTGFVRTVETTDANMSVYYLLLRFWLHLGHDPTTVRLLSAIAGILTIPLVYAIGSGLFGRRAGILAAFFAALDPLQLAAAQEARAYSLVALLITCSTWAFVHIVGDESIATGGRAGDREAGQPFVARQVFWCSLYACTSALALYAHFYAGFVLLAQWLSLTARPPGRWWRPLLASAAGSGLLLIPLGLFFLRGPHNNIDWLTDAYRTLFQRVIDTLHSPPFGPVAPIIYGCTILAVAWAAALRVQSASNPPQRWARLLVLLWLIVPIAIPLAISVAIKPVLDPRYLGVCTPAFVLAAASALAAVRPRRLAMAAVAWIVILGALADWTYFTSFHKEDWRDATREMLDDSRPGDVAIFYARYVRRPFDFYAELAAKASNAPQPQILYPDAAYADFSSPVPGLSLQGAVDQARVTATRTWIVISHTGSADADCIQALDEALRPAFPKVEERDYPSMKIRLYSRTQAGIDAPGAGAAALPPIGTALLRECTQA